MLNWSPSPQLSLPPIHPTLVSDWSSQCEAQIISLPAQESSVVRHCLEAPLPLLGTEVSSKSHLPPSSVKFLFLLQQNDLLFPDVLVLTTPFFPPWLFLKIPLFLHGSANTLSSPQNFPIPLPDRTSPSSELKLHFFVHFLSSDKSSFALTLLLVVCIIYGH